MLDILIGKWRWLSGLRKLKMSVSRKISTTWTLEVSRARFVRS